MYNTFIKPIYVYMFKYVYMYIYVNIFFLSQSVYINSVYRPHISHIYHVCVQTERKK